VSIAARRPVLTAALLYLGLGLIVVAPALVDPTGLAIGHPEADTYNHLWGYWHVVGQLLQGRSPLDAPGLGWPTGGRLYFIDMLGALLTAPVQLLGGPVLAYNLGLAGNVALAGLGAFLLARRLGYPASAAGFVGFAYATTPHLLGQLTDGISETAGVGWLPLSVLATLRWLDEPGPRRGAELGLALASSTLASFYYGLFSGMFVAAILLHQALLRPRFWSRAAVWRSAGLAALTLLVVAGPALWAFQRTLSASDALVTREEGFVALTLTGHNMVDLLSFFRPGRSYSPDLRALYDEALIVVVYAGWTLILAATAAVVRALRRPAELARLRPWLAGALISFILALGPYLYLGGGYAQLPGGGPLPLPFLALARTLPIFSRISHAFRFVVPLGLCLSMLAGAWIATRRRHGPVALTLGALWALELVFLSPVPLPLPVADTGRDPPNGALNHKRGPVRPPDGGACAQLDLPISLQVLARSRYAWQQTWHGWRIPYGLNDPTPRALADNRLGQALISLERSSLDTLPPELNTLDLEVGLRALEAQGLCTILVHSELYPPTLRDKVVSFLDIVVGDGTWEADNRYYWLGDHTLKEDHDAAAPHPD